MPVPTTLLVFYHGHGFNPTWVMLPDNATVFKWMAAENEKVVLATVMVQELAGFMGRMLPAIDEARKGMENGYRCISCDYNYITGRDVYLVKVTVQLV